MNRETINFTTPSGQNTIVFNSYLTGREKRIINSIYYKEAGEVNGDELKLKGLKGYIIEQVQNTTFKLLIVSVNGKKDGEVNPDGTKFDVIDYLLDLKSSEFDSVANKINSIIKDADSSENSQKKTT